MGASARPRPIVGVQYLRREYEKLQPQLRYIADLADLLNCIIYGIYVKKVGLWGKRVDRWKQLDP